MNALIKNQIGARFKLVVRKSSDDSITKETGWFKNLVLDSGLDQMGKGTWITGVAVGSGSSAPNVTQTKLDNLVAWSTNRTKAEYNVQNVKLPHYRYALVTWRFGEGVAQGNLTEVGLGWAQDLMWNRTLIKDINGQPTTLTILPDEYLDVMAEVRVYVGGTTAGAVRFVDKTGTLISEHTYKVYPNSKHASADFTPVSPTSSIRSHMYSQHVGKPNTEPSGHLGQGTLVIKSTQPRSRTFHALFGLTVANGSHASLYCAFNGLLGTDAGSGSGYQFEFTPPIVKTKEMEVRYTVTVAWERYEGVD